MEDLGSLKQTITHLFDAVRYSAHAKELEEAARGIEGKLEEDLNRLENHTEELSNLLTTMKEHEEAPVKDMSEQVMKFLAAAKDQAKTKLERRSKQESEQYRENASTERDKAVKSLENYLASDPLPILDNAVSIRLVDGSYTAHSRYETEGEMKYEFVLAAQNSALFHQELTLSQLGHELRVPVRIARTLLKGRVPGFEKLDQYVLADAEASGGKIRATFSKLGSGSRIKVVTSGNDGFVGLEYSDRTQTVNVMSDPSLSGQVDLEAIRAAMSELANHLEELANKRVSLTRLTIEGLDVLKGLECYAIMQRVFQVLGPKYRAVVKTLPEAMPYNEMNGGLGLKFVRERLKLLGDLSKPVSQSLGLGSSI